MSGLIHVKKADLLLIWAVVRNTINHLQLPISALGLDHTLGAVHAGVLVCPCQLHWLACITEQAWHLNNTYTPVRRSPVATFS